MAVTQASFDRLLNVEVGHPHDSLSSWWASLRAATYAFVVSRALIAAIFVLATNFDSGSPAGASQWREATASLTTQTVTEGFERLVRFNDGYWYSTIAERGYDPGPFDATSQRNWAFFPLFPLLWRSLAAIGLPFALAGFLLANLCFFVALVVVHQLCLDLRRGNEGANRAVLVLSLFPSSYFFSLPWTESLFVLCCAGAFLAAYRDHWRTAALLASLAAGTRITGVFLLPALAVLHFSRYRFSKPQRWTALALILVPPLMFMAFLANTTGDALAFVHIQSAFGRAAPLSFDSLMQGISFPGAAIKGWNFRWYNALAMSAGLLSAVHLARRGDWPLAIFLALGLCVALSTLTVMSGARYTIGLVPFAIALSDYTARREAGFAAAVTGAAGLAALSLLFALDVHFAGA